MAKHFGCARYIYNGALAEKAKHYKDTGKSLSRRAIQNILVAHKKDGKEWLSEVNSQSLLAALANLRLLSGTSSKVELSFLSSSQKIQGGNLFNAHSMSKLILNDVALRFQRSKGSKLSCIVIL